MIRTTRPDPSRMVTGAAPSSSAASLRPAGFIDTSPFLVLLVLSMRSSPARILATAICQDRIARRLVHRPYLHDGRLLTLGDTVEFFNLVLELRLTHEEKRGCAPPPSVWVDAALGGNALVVELPTYPRVTAEARGAR